MLYKTFLKHYLKKDISLTEDTFKAALLSSEYTPNTSDEFFSDISFNEIEGTNYETGGKSFSFSGPIESSIDNSISFRGQNVIWEDATFSNARYAVIYKADEALDYLVAYFDFGEGKSVSSGNFILGWRNQNVITLNPEEISSSTTITNVDDALSSTSENPVQNKVLTKALQLIGINLDGENITDESLEALKENLDHLSEVDSEDISKIFGSEGSGSGDDTPVYSSVDEFLSSTSTNPVQNRILTKALQVLGICLDNEEITDDSLSVLRGNVDYLSEASNNEIYGIFGSEGGDSTPIYSSIDNALSITSENPVQNKVLTKALRLIGIKFNDEDVTGGDPSLAALNEGMDSLAPSSDEEIHTMVKNTLDEEEESPSDPMIASLFEEE